MGSAFRLLPSKTFEQAFQKAQALIGTNANCDVREHENLCD